MPRHFIPLTLSLALLCQPAAADPLVQSHDEAAQANIRPTLTIESRTGQDKRWRQHKAASLKAGDDLWLRVKPIPRASVRWYLVFADLSKPYKNANHPWEPNAYQWTGLQQIDYYRVELPTLRDHWEVQPLLSNLHDDVRAWLKDQGRGAYDVFYHDDLGTFRFQAVATDGDKTWRSPGVEDVDELGISRSVFRVSVRRDDTQIGHLTSFYNVPGVFGSTTPQSTHYLGVDCADVLVSAHRLWQNKKGSKNYNVAMLAHGQRKVATLTLDDGALEGEAPAWGDGADEVRPGDFIAVQYEGATRFGHIGALAGDTDGDGVLSLEDEVLHAGPWPLHPTALGDGAFDGQIVILRPRGKL